MENEIGVSIYLLIWFKFEDFSLMLLLAQIL